jgi:Sodium Bile acid symporter family
MTLQQAIVLALQVSILMTVFSFGLRTTVDDVLYVVRRPSLLARSLLAMFVIMPIVAVALARLFELRPSVEIALVALAISPIPPLLPGREQKAGGHASYALGLMMIVAVLSIATVPAAVDLVGRYFMKPFAMSSGAIASIVLKAAILPLVAGMVFRALLPAGAARIAKPVQLIATVLLVAGVLALLAGTLAVVFSLLGNGKRHRDGGIRRGGSGRRASLWRTERRRPARAGAVDRQPPSGNRAGHCESQLPGRAASCRNHHSVFGDQPADRHSVSSVAEAPDRVMMRGQVFQRRARRSHGPHVHDTHHERPERGERRAAGGFARGAGMRAA